MFNSDSIRFHSVVNGVSFDDLLSFSSSDFPKVEDYSIYCFLKVNDIVFEMYFGLLRVHFSLFYKQLHHLFGMALLLTLLVRVCIVCYPDD